MAEAQPEDRFTDEVEQEMLSISQKHQKPRLQEAHKEMMEGRAVFLLVDDGEKVMFYTRGDGAVLLDMLISTLKSKHLAGKLLRAAAVFAEEDEE